MFDWLKNLLPRRPEPPSESPPTADEAMARLQTLTTDAMVEDVWDGMDLHAAELRPLVRDRLREGTLGRYPAHAATIWLAYQQNDRDELAGPVVLDRLRDSIEWALGFEENNILIGGALGALGSVGGERREQMALSIFESLGQESLRRYWLLLKVRTDAMMEAVAEALEDYQPERRAKMAGAFRQFTPGDVDLVLRHYRPESPGAAMFIEALGATRSPRAREALEDAVDDPRPEVAEAARRGLRQMRSE